MVNNFDQLSDEELDQLVAQKMASAKHVSQSVSTQRSAPAPRDLSQLSDDELDQMVAAKISRSPSQFPVTSLPPDQGVINEGVPMPNIAPPQEQPRQYPKFKFNPEGVKNEQGGQAGLEAIGNAISFGYLPQIQAFVESLYSDQPYVDLRDENLARQESQAQQFPEKVIAGNVLGSIATAPIGGAAVRSVGMAPGVTSMARLKDAAIMGAGYGGVYNPGDTQGVVDPLQLSERGTNAGKGALMGLATQGLGEGVAKTSEAIKKAPEVLNKVANVTAVKSIGAIGRDMKKLFRNNNAHEIGDTLIKSGVVQAGDTIEDIAKKSASLKNETGKKLGDIYKAASAELSDPEKLAKMSVKNRKLLEMTQLDGEKLADLSLKRIESNLKNDLARTEIKEKVLGTLQELQSKGKNIDILDLQEMKSKLDKRINYDKALKDMPEVQQEFKVIRDKLNKAIQNRVRVFGRVSGNKELINELREANKTYGHLARAESIASSRAKEIEGHRWLSLGDRLSAGTGASIGAMTGDSPEERVKNAVIGFAAGAAAGKAERFITPTIARSAKRLSVLLKEPANFAKYGEPLIEAAKKSPQEFQAFINQMSKDPEFKRFAKPAR